MNATPRARLTLVLLAFCMCGSAALVSHFITAARLRAGERELFAIFERHWSAFRASDYRRAYQQVSGEMQSSISFARFEQLARHDYAPLREATEVEIGPCQVRGERAFLQIYLLDKNGRVTPCIYVLRHDGDAWRVDNVRLLPRWPDGSALKGTRS